MGVSKGNRFQELSEKLLLKLGAPGWAWEWLRRNPAYARAVGKSLKLLRQVLREHPFLEVLELQSAYKDKWGLCFPEDHSRAYTNAAVFWRPEYDPSIIPVAAVPAEISSPDALDFRDLKFAVRILKTPEGEHVQLSNGFHSIQINVISGTVLDGPVRLAYILSGQETLNARRVPVERLIALKKQKRFPAKMFTEDSRASRWLLALKAIDMERSGMSQPDIAAHFYPGTEHADFVTNWRRSRLRRLLDTGHEMISGGGYLKILARSVKAMRRAV